MGQEGISTGYDDGTYRPSAPVSRQAMSAFMYRLADEPAFVKPPTPSFDDVGLTHPFFREVEWLASTGVTTGYDDGGYHPAAAVSRQAMAAFLYRLAGSPGVGLGAPTFDDVDTDHPFFAEIEYLAAKEITGGYPDGGYHPSANVTRQAMSAFMHRFADNLGVNV
jgi:hypothetical protein